MEERDLIYQKLRIFLTPAVIKSVNPSPNTCKNDALSEKARQRGNEIFNQKEHTEELDQEIWIKYCLSIAYAVKGSEKEAFGFSNRSTFFFHISKYKEALIDIEKAIQIAKTNELKFKFSCRKVKCLIQIDKKEAEKVFQEAKSYFSDIDNKSEFIKLLKDTEELLSKGKIKPNDKIHEVDPINIKKKYDCFNSVTIRNNREFGRHLVATYDIQPGEIIFIEKPLAFTLNFTACHAICSHCCTMSWNLIGCDKCPWTMYCSEKCKEDAWTQYHDMECSSFTTINKRMYLKDVTDFLAITLKLIIIEYKKAGSIANLREIVLSAIKDNKENPLSNFVTDKHVTNKGIRSIMSFKCLVDTRCSNLLIHKTSVILVSLAKNTQIFGKIFNDDECMKLYENEDALFISTLAYRLLKIYFNYGSPIINKCIFYQNKKDPVQMTFMSRGNSIPTIYTLINHDCDPNVDKCYTYDNRLVAYALKPIKKNEQLFSSRFSSFYRTSKKDRINFLSSKYVDFVCNCNACKGNWSPLMVEFTRNSKGNLHKFLSQSFKTIKEFELYIEHQDAIVNIFLKDETFEFSKKMMQDLSKSLIDATQEFTQPSLIICLLIEVLRLSFIKFYMKCLPISACSKTAVFHVLL